jgi:P-type Mg2+ transporter
MTSAKGDLPYWSADQGALMKSLGSGSVGLGADEATRILAKVGPNSVEEATRLTALRLLLRQFESPLVLILTFAAAMSLALQQWVDAGIILAIVVGSALLSFFQEYRASTAVEELKKRLALTARVLRDGMEQSVPVAQIVPGDLILLSAGNLIPVDGRVIEAQDFLVSEASMTGESFPVEKRAGQVRVDAPITERTNTVFMGASVRSGSAKVLAVNTGRKTEFGAIAARLRAPVRLSVDPGDGGHRHIRTDGKPAAAAASSRIPAVCRGARRRAFTGTSASNHQRDPFRWGACDGQARRHCPPSGCH